MKRLALIPATALAAVALLPGTASAHDVVPTVESVCYPGGVTVATVTFTNDFDMGATVRIDGAELTLPPSGTATHDIDFTDPGVEHWSALWLDGWLQTGDVELVPVEGCPERRCDPFGECPTTTTICRPQVNGRECGPIEYDDGWAHDDDLGPGTVVVTPLPTVTTTVPVEASSVALEAQDDAVDELAFTGAATGLLMVIGGGLVGAGAIMAHAAWQFDRRAARLMGEDAR